MARNDDSLRDPFELASQWSARDSEREPHQPARRSSSVERQERVRMSIGWSFVRNYGEEE